MGRKFYETHTKMQFAVPQFTDVEDKLIGPLTLKQFLVLLGTGGVVLFFWSLLGLSLFFFVFAAPFALLGLGIAFGKFNGRSLFNYIGPMISYFVNPKVLIFKRDESNIKIISSAVEAAPVKASETLEPPVSRLKSLAYLLDQKNAEEKELIHNKID